MSFNRYKKKTVGERLTEAHNYPSTNRTGNLLRNVTIGLARLYGLIEEKSSIYQENCQQSTSDGFLALIPRPVQNLLLNKRYSHEKLLATGTFAQIHLCHDIYLGKRVAVKITKEHCDLLSYREKAFLDHVYSCEKRGVSYFARVMDIFVHEGHVCLVMPYYHGTLMGFVTENSSSTLHLHTPSFKFSTPRRSHPVEGVSMVDNSEILQPRPLRPTVSQAALSIKPTLPMSATKVTPSKPNPPLREFSISDLQTIKRIAMQLLSALWVLQKEDIIHGDLKPENCFLDIPSSSAFFAASNVDKDHQISSSVASAAILSSSPFTANSSYTSQTPLAPQNSTDAVNISSHISSASAHNFRLLSSLPQDAKIKLGDFGNALHVSELQQYYEEFEIQSMPYRAPEVLLGLRFTCAIDIWSLGIMLIELIIGQTLFHGRSREEAILDIENNICKLSKTRFSSGKFAHCLLQASRWQAGSPGFTGNHNIESSQWNRLEQVKSIKRLLSKHVIATSIPQNDWNILVDFLTCLTAVDPTHRISPFDALQHNFLINEATIPMGLVAQAVQDAEDYASSGSSLGRASKRRRIASGANLFHSLKHF